MAEESIKKRLRKAKTKAAAVLEDSKFKIIPSDNSIFCILAVRKKEIRLIRVVVDEISNTDVDLVRNFDHPEICTKEIWCRKYKCRKFEVREVM
jgi:hypothetical protein